MVESVPERLRAAAKLFEERNAAYGGNYIGFGRTMQVLFPDGLGSGDLSDHEWGRLCHVVHIMTKLTRYCRNLRRGGHRDSLDDMAVYTQMLAEIDDLEHAALLPEEEVPEAKARAEAVGAVGGLKGVPLDPLVNLETLFGIRLDELADSVGLRRRVVGEHPHSETGRSPTESDSTLRKRIARAMKSATPAKVIVCRTRDCAVAHPVLRSWLDEAGTCRLHVTAEETRYLSRSGQLVADVCDIDGEWEIRLFTQTKTDGIVTDGGIALIELPARF